jgi:hypothetical protein
VRYEVDIPDTVTARQAVRTLCAVLNEGRNVVILRAPEMPEEMWRALSPTLVPRAIAALHGSPLIPA